MGGEGGLPTNPGTAPAKRETGRSRMDVVARGVFSTGSGTLVSNVTGLVRQLVFAWIYGAGRNMDAFLIASIISQMVFGSIDSALSSTLIPVYSTIRERSEAEAQQFLAAVSSLVTVCTAMAALLLYLFAPLFVRLLAPGFGSAEAKITTDLLRVMMPSLLFMGLSSVSVGYLQAHGHFASPALMYIPRNIILIVGAALLGRHFGIGVLAWGTLLGAVFQLVVVLWPSVRAGAPAQLVWEPLHAGIRMMLSRLPAVSAYFFMYQAALIVDRILASGLPTGMISALNYAQILLNPPLAMITTLAVALFPTLSDMVAKNHGPQLTRAVVRALNLTTFFAVPLTFFIVLFRIPLVAILYDHGSFGVVALRRTAFALAFFGAAFVSLAWNGALARTIFALGETRVLLTSATAAVLTTIITDLLLIHPLQQGGLALGTSLGSWVGTFMMLRILRRKMEGFRPWTTVAPLVETGLVGGVAFGLTALLVGKLLPSPVTGDFAIRLIVLIVGGAVGMAGYVGVHALSPGGRTRVREVFALVGRVVGRAGDRVV